MSCVYLADEDSCARAVTLRCPLWMNVSHQTKHDTKLPTYYKRWLKYFIYSADYLWRVYAAMLFQLQNVKKRQATNWNKHQHRQKTTAAHTEFYSDKLSRPSRTMNPPPQPKAQRQKNRSAIRNARVRISSSFDDVSHLRGVRFRFIKWSTIVKSHVAQIQSLSAHKNRPSSNGRSMCIYKFERTSPVSNFRPTKSRKKRATRGRKTKKRRAKNTNAHEIGILAPIHTHF